MYAPQDKGQYMKGLLSMLKFNRKLDPAAVEFVEWKGTRLGYSRDFCTDVIGQLYENKYIGSEPVVFSSRTAALNFIEDLLELFARSPEPFVEKIEFIKRIAERNNLNALSVSLERSLKHNRRRVSLSPELPRREPESRRSGYRSRVIQHNLP